MKKSPINTTDSLQEKDRRIANKILRDKLKQKPTKKISGSDQAKKHHEAKKLKQSNKLDKTLQDTFPASDSITKY